MQKKRFGQRLRKTEHARRGKEIAVPIAILKFCFNITQFAVWSFYSLAKVGLKQEKMRRFFFFSLAKSQDQESRHFNFLKRDYHHLRLSRLLVIESETFKKSLELASYWKF